MHRCTTTNTKASRKPSGELYLKVVSCTFSEHVRPYMPGPQTTSMLNFAQAFQTMDRLDLKIGHPEKFHGFKPHFTLEKRQHIGLKSHHWRNHESLDGPEAWSWVAASPDKSLHAYFSKSENGGFTPFLAIYREHSYELWDFELFPIISEPHKHQVPTAILSSYVCISVARLQVHVRLHLRGMQHLQ